MARNARMSKKEVTEATLARTVVPKGNVLYALVVFSKDVAAPVVIQSYDPLPIPELGSLYEVRSAGTTLSGSVKVVETIVSDTGLAINVASQITLD